MVEEVICVFGLLELCMDIDLVKNKVGIYSCLVKFIDMVQDGDWVEIYCFLIVDLKVLCCQCVEKLVGR